MITTTQLKEWKDKILENRKQAEFNAMSKADNKAISEYYMHCATVCANQASIIERLIIYSQQFDKGGE